MLGPSVSATPTEVSSDRDDVFGGDLALPFPPTIKVSFGINVGTVTSCKRCLY